MTNPRSRADVRRLIEPAVATVVVDSPPRAESVALLRSLEPDAVLLSAEDAVRSGDGLRTALSRDLPAPVVLVAGPRTAGALTPDRIAGVMAVVLGPLRAEELRPTVEIAIARFGELRRLRRVLADRPVVDAAKARLMARDGVVGLLAKRGATQWDEPVSGLDHALQCAALARAARAPDEVVLAALLHDVGHLLTASEETPFAHHGLWAARFLRQIGHAILEPPCHDQEALLLGFNTRNKTLILGAYLAIPAFHLLRTPAWTAGTLGPVMATVALRWLRWTLPVVGGRVLYLVWAHIVWLALVWVVKLVTDPLTDLAAYSPRYLGRS